MKGDIVLRIIIGFLIPFAILYSFFYFFYIMDIGFVAVLNCSVILLISYIIYFIRFDKINIIKLVSADIFVKGILLGFLFFLIFLLKTLLKF